MRAIRISRWGGPEVLELVDDAPVPEPGEGEVLVKVSRAGVNFADTHARENTYLATYELPLTPGAEVAGVVERDGAGFRAGQRVVGLVANGGYAQYAVVPAAATFPLPDGVSDTQALALLIQGLTAWHLYRTSARVSPGESVVVIAGAGGVGSLAVQLGKPMGAGRVIATASTQAKRDLTVELGADVALEADAENLKDRLIAANEGRQVDVVFEMAGGEVFDACLAALAPFGRLVTYGIASGKGNEVHTRKLMGRSRAVIGFWLMHCLGRRDMLQEPLADLYARAARGELRAVVGATYPLSEARQAQIDLAERRTTGKVLLDPSA
jgi:NADPH2:quinone reductase